MLQCRNGKRTARAAVRIAVEMVHERLIDEREAVLRVEPESLDQLLHPTLDPTRTEDAARARPRGEPGRGERHDRVRRRRSGAARGARKPVILVRVETSPEDIHGMKAARGILTARGGMTSHAAVVARGMGKPCVAGTTSVQVRYDNQTATFTATRAAAEDPEEGRRDHDRRRHRPVFVGAVADRARGALPRVRGAHALGRRASHDERARQRRHAARRAHRARVRRRGHRPLPHRAHVLRRRAHHGDARDDPRRDEEAARTRAREAPALPAQGLRRDLPRDERAARHDPPARSAAPRVSADGAEAGRAGRGEHEAVAPQAIAQRTKDLHEFNPMLGHRGCRLAITYPEIYAMQARAILEAAQDREGRRTSTSTPRS